ADHYRRPGRGRRAAPDAGCLRPPRCLPVRLLHTGADLFGGGPGRREPRPGSGRDSRADERQPLPLRRLPEHPRGGGRSPAGHPPAVAGECAMTPFSYARPERIEEALALAGPDSRYIAGGTNLLDLMKENVLQPRQLIDINRLPLRAIEET